MRNVTTTYTHKVCAYITRNGRELLVFDGPDHDGLQIPKGTVEPDETIHEAVRREIREESGLSNLESLSHLRRDLWTRRLDPPTRYVRDFFHASVSEARDEWCHIVTGTGDERGTVFEFFWVDLPTGREFALELDEYVSHVEDTLAHA